MIRKVIGMVKIFKYKNGKVKIMWNEQPLLKDYKYNWRKKLINIKTYEFLSTFLLGVEIKIHTGGKICYGMLAAKIYPLRKQDCVEIELAFTHKNSVKYEASGLIDDTHVYKGLPEEYTERMINQICSTILEKEKYPQCKIVIEDSANCEIGSSPMFFGMIADIIVNLIYTSSEDEIYNMNIETFTNQYMKYKLVY